MTEERFKREVTRLLLDAELDRDLSSGVLTVKWRGQISKSEHARLGGEVRGAVISYLRETYGDAWHSRATEDERKMLELHPYSALGPAR